VSVSPQLIDEVVALLADALAPKLVTRDAAAARRRAVAPRRR
jgi:hypothetical protein